MFVRRRRAITALLAAIGLAMGWLLLAGPYGGTAGADVPDLTVAIPVFPAVPFQPAAEGKPCYEETVRRQAAERNVAAAAEVYRLEKEAMDRGGGASASVYAATRDLAEMQKALVEAAYAEASCYLKQTNNGQGDKCTQLALDYNRLADLIVRQQALLASHQDELRRVIQLQQSGAASRREVLMVQVAVNNADADLKILKSRLVAAEAAIKKDCPNTRYQRPAQAPPPRPVGGCGDETPAPGDDPEPCPTDSPTDSPTESPTDSPSTAPVDPTLAPPTVERSITLAPTDGGGTLAPVDPS
jgi:hypothetical protein